MLSNWDHPCRVIPLPDGYIPYSSFLYFVQTCVKYGMLSGILEAEVVPPRKCLQPCTISVLCNWAGSKGHPMPGAGEQ